MSNAQSNGLQSSKHKEKIVSVKILLLCIIAALFNFSLNHVVSAVAQFPLFLDTVFIVAVCFSVGFVPALFMTFVLGPIISHIIPLLVPSIIAIPFWWKNLFTLCTLSEIILVTLFSKKMKPKEDAFLKKTSLALFTPIAARLLILVVLDCIIISIIGGILDAILTPLSAQRIFASEDTFKLVLLRSNMNYLPAAILSRIPINIVDRFIVVFGGFGLSILWKKVMRKSEIRTLSKSQSPYTTR
jgi:hypothetical protein